MWIITDVIILSMCSIALGNWAAGKLYILGWFGYEYLGGVKILLTCLVGVTATIYLVARGW